MAAGIDVPKPSAASALVTGLKVRGEFRCAGCGYGISISRELPLCPMCGTGSWEQLQWGAGPMRRND